MKSKKIIKARRSGGDRRSFSYTYTLVVPERREKIRRNVPDRRQLYANHIRRKYD